MSGLVHRIQRALADPLSRDDVIDPMQELGALLREVGLDPAAGGGTVSFAGRDPIVASPLPFATIAAVALMAKSISVAALWRFRGGAGQDLSVDLGQALHRLYPFYDRKWELLNGYAPGNPADPANPFIPTNMYPTRDGRRVLFMNIYPRIRSAALAFLGCNDDPCAVGAVIRKWDAFEFEEQAYRAGLQATIVRSADEFLQSEQCHNLASLPLVHIEKIADGEPQPFFANPARPLDGVRALGFSHVIAGPGMGRAFAYHGADVLNIWQPTSFEMDFNYYTANVGMRSATRDLSHPEGIGHLRRLVSQADVFFANRGPGQIEKLGLSTAELASLRPGIVQVDISIYGRKGPWAGRIGFDHTAGGVSGILALEGSVETPMLPEIFVVNDYIASWIATVGAIAALRRRARGRQLPRQRVFGPRITMAAADGDIRQGYARKVAGTTGRHAYRDPETFEAETPCGHYQGVTDQVTMSGTPGFYATPLVPRGSSRAEWLPR